MVDTINDVGVYRLTDGGPVLGSYTSATDLIGQLYGLAADMIVIPAARLDTEFFRLGSGVAGAFIEKLQQYGLRLAIVGDIDAIMETSAALQDFVRETNRHGYHLFVRDEADLAERLRRQGAVA